MPRILIIGGTGMLGRPVAVHLLNENFQVRIFTTNENRAKAFFGDRVEYAPGDVGNIDSLRKGIEGCDAIYINLKGGPLPADYIRIEQEGSKNIYRAALEVGVNRVVQISEARADKKHSQFIHEKVKYEAEKVMVASGLNYTILKPTWFCESLPLFLKDNKAVYIGSGKTLFHFLAVADYARIVAECFKSDKANNKILTIFGPEAMPISEALRRFLEICHPDIAIDRLPIWLAKFSMLFMFNKTLKSAVNLMAFFDKHGDDEVETSPDEADRLFGRSTITVEEWAKIYRKIVKGV
ncbi:MAG: NAD(P)H-binding protein [candidate division Zixibacteria bacterium]